VLVGSDLELEPMLQRIIEAAVDLVDARYGALGVLDESGGRLAEFITVGIDGDGRTAIGDLPKGLGLLGSIIHDAQPLRLAEITEHPDSSGFPPNHPPMTSFLGVPVRVRGTVFGNLYLTDKTSAEVFSDIDEELATGLAAAAGVAIENARLYDHGRRREAAMAALKEVATALVDDIDRGDSHQLVAHHARQLLGADLATITEPEPGGERLVIEIVDGAGSDDLRGRSFPRGGTVAGDVLRTGTTVAVEDCGLHDRVHPDHLDGDHFGPALFVSLSAAGEPFATLTVARHRPAPTFGPADIELIETFATQASLVLDRDRGRHHLQRLRLLEDQERIGRDLHDTVIGDLFGVGLSLQSALGAVHDPATSERIGVAIDQIDRTIARIRTVIFGIEVAAADPDGRLRDTILDVVHDRGALLQAAPTIRFAGNLDVVPERVGSDAIATLREAIANIVKHARATSVDIEVTVDDALTMRVTDDGVGPGPTGRTHDGNGLHNMRTRAEQLGGTFTITPGPQAGAVLTWSVPLVGPTRGGVR
jgi:signal transduction histidine kinase